MQHNQTAIMETKIKLEVNIDPNAGFCFGVVGAIDKAEKGLKTQTQLYSVGEIVHNDEEVKRLENIGLNTIMVSDLDNIKDSVVLFRAHGEPPTTYERVKANNNTIIDGTCPVVLAVQKRVKKSYENKETIYIYGKRNHPETIGIMGHINNSAIVFEDINELDIPNIPKKITLYSQTTKSLESFHKNVKTLTDAGIEVKIQDTVCRQVSNRNEELSKFAAKYDCIVFVAGNNSSNGKVLYEICKKSNPKTYFISKVESIDKNWFENVNTVGISGATSTPMWLMEKTKASIENLD